MEKLKCNPSDFNSLVKEYLCINKTISIIEKFKKLGYNIRNDVYNDYLQKRKELKNKIDNLKNKNEKKKKIKKE